MTGIVLAVLVLLTAGDAAVRLPDHRGRSCSSPLWPPFRNMITTNINLMLTMLIGGCGTAPVGCS
jgi:hypothetical protein